VRSPIIVVLQPSNLQDTDVVEVESCGMMEIPQDSVANCTSGGLKVAPLPGKAAMRSSGAIAFDVTVSKVKPKLTALFA
jgi:hypothetical protein